MYEMVYCFSKNGDYRDYAIRQLKALQLSPTAQAARAQPEAFVPIYPSGEQDNGRGIAQNMSQRFWNEEKFSGKLDEDLIEYLKTYEKSL